LSKLVVDAVETGEGVESATLGGPDVGPI